MNGLPDVPFSSRSDERTKPDRRLTLADVFVLLQKPERPPLTESQSTLIWNEVERLLLGKFNQVEENSDYPLPDEDIFVTLELVRRDDVTFSVRARQRLEWPGEDNFADNSVTKYAIFSLLGMDLDRATFAPLLYAIAVDPAHRFVSPSGRSVRMAALSVLRRIVPGSTWLRDALREVGRDKRIDVFARVWARFEATRM